MKNDNDPNNARSGQEDNLDKNKSISASENSLAGGVNSPEGREGGGEFLQEDPGSLGGVVNEKRNKDKEYGKDSEALDRME